MFYLLKVRKMYQLIIVRRFLLIKKMENKLLIILKFTSLHDN